MEFNIWWQKIIVKNLNRCPKNCILCEEWVLFKAPLCRSCRRYLYSESKSNSGGTLNILDHRCYYLWFWNNQNHLWIQKVILAMKDGYNSELYKVFMPWLINKINHFDKVKNVVAVPSLDRKHPEKLMETLHLYKDDIKTFRVFKNTPEAQKFKTKSQRLNMEFEFYNKPLIQDNYKSKILDLLKIFHLRIRTQELRAEKPKFFKNRSLIIDDVVATGGSMRGLIKLIKPRNVHSLAVWAYKSKERLNGSTKNKSRTVSFEAL